MKISSGSSALRAGYFLALWTLVRAKTLLNAAFVPAASPSAASRCQTQQDFLHRSPGEFSISLQAKKKNAPPTSSAKKIQVKLLKYVAGTGQAGEIIMVTPPFFNNKLRPTKSAVMITDEEVAKEQMESNEQQRQLLEQANRVKQTLEALTVQISRKAGPDGQLFGGVGPKLIMDELASKLGGEEFLGSKGVKIASITDPNGEKMRGDIKNTGEFEATVTLAKDVSAKLTVTVKAES
jgi:large subunit ribosomal protein L9